MDDDEQLAEQIIRLLDSEELMERVGKAGEATIRDKVNIDRLVEGFRMAVFNEHGRYAPGVGMAANHKGGKQG